MSDKLENITKKRILCFDTETTGLPKPKRVSLDLQPKIIELGLVVYETDLIDTKIIKRLSQILDPMEGIAPNITKINGITNDMIKGKPTFKEFLPEFITYFEGVDCMVAHNAAFDVTMLGYELNRLGADANKQFPWPPYIACSVQEYYHRFGYRPPLEKLYEFINKKPLEQTHRALDDAEALAEILIADYFAEWYL